MKRFGVLSGLFLFIFLASLSIASAVDTYQCDDKQVIFRVSDLTNAHGEKYLQTPFFTKEICYNEIFGKPYAPNGAHSCTQTNTVIRLVTDSNSHAAKNTYNLYPVRVCYGDLVCTMKATCGPGEVAVAKLSGDGTNSHIEVRNGNVYGNSICCTSASAGIDPNKCGNGQIDAGEQCDGGIGANTCQSLNLGFDGGTLKCNSKGAQNQCMFDTTSCTTPGGGGPNDGGGAPKGCITRLNETSCNVVNETNLKSILKEDPSWKSSCDNGDVSCSCNWDANNNGGTCEFRRKSIGTNDNGGTCDNTCDSTSTTGQCVDGYLTLNILSKYNGNCQIPDPTCKNEQKTLLCGSPTLKLPSFGNLQAFAVIIAIALIYALAIVKKRK